MKKIALVMGILFVVSACQMVNGLGKDIKRLGDSISNTAQEYE